MAMTQSNKSVLALVFTAAFLITGKIFIWKSGDKAPAVQQNDPANIVAEVAQTTDYMTIAATVTTTTETTTSTTTTTTYANGFSLIPPDYVVPYNPDTAAPTESTVSTETVTTTVTEITTAVTEAPVTETAQSDAAAAPAGYFNDALFIGDSRMVGIASYGPIEGATYFATVGLSTYKIDSALSEVESTKNQTFNQVLNGKKYGKVYIMLGINEIGMDFNTTMQNMDNIIAQIRTAQPGAKIILMANLHVSAARHYSDAVVNNTKINSFNALLAAKADNKTIFYLDVNPQFDDAEGCLGSEYTSDNTHPYAKYYVTWSEWLKTQIF